MNTFLSTIGATVIIVPIVLVIAIGAILWRAWWLYPAWAWFIVPLGISQISFWDFAALLTLISIVTGHADFKKDDRPVDWSKAASALLLPITTWAILWWLHR